VGTHKKHRQNRKMQKKNPETIQKKCVFPPKACTFSPLFHQHSSIITLISHHFCTNTIKGTDCSPLYSPPVCPKTTTKFCARRHNAKPAFKNPRPTKTAHYLRNKPRAALVSQAFSAIMALLFHRSPS
jgi:hypothetical protein